MVQDGATELAAAGARVNRNILLLAALLLAVVFGFLFFYPTRNSEPRNDAERKIAFAVEQASNACLADVTTKERKEIENRVAAGVTDIGARGSITVENTRSAVDLALSEPGLLAEREKVRECIKQSLPLFLGLQQERATGAAAKGNPELEPARAVATKAVREGWIYYEEAAGDATDEGVFGVAGRPKLPSYRDLSVGTILKARSTARLRQGPGKTEVLSLVDAGTCARIAAAPSNPFPTEKASSGGHLRVEILSRCP
jgi:hypothetical protein